MRTARWIAVAAVVAYLATGVVQVRPGEVAVVRRFGRVVATPGPGLWVGLPWGFDRVDRVAVDRVRRVAVGTDDADPLLTGDQNLVQVRAAVEYTVRLDEVATYVAEADRVDDAVARTAEAALAEWAAGHGIDDALLTGKATLPAWLAARVRDRLEPYRLGIDVRAAGVTELAPPDEVRGAFDAVTRAQASIRTREQEAEQEAERLHRSARATKYALEQQASASAHAAVEAAKADADAFRLRLEQHRRTNALAALWWAELGPLFARMQAAGRVQLLDERLGADGLDIMQKVPEPKK
ncbi:MAG: SPFH domain-containing protein [Gemmataceae bacterium]